MEYRLVLDNIKCGGCGNTIHNTVLKSPGVEDVEVDHENGIVTILGSESLNLDSLKSTLASLGYPEAGMGTGMQKAKSYVSCMIGRMTPKQA